MPVSSAADLAKPSRIVRAISRSLRGLQAKICLPHATYGSMIQGTCQCEGVHVEVDEVHPLGVNCYCSICRKISGAPFAAALTAARNAFRITKGWELLSKYNATPNYDRWHCSRCHAPIYGEITDQPSHPLYVSAAILEPEAIAHVRFDHIFVRSLVPWHRILDARKQHETFPS